MKIAKTDVFVAPADDTSFGLYMDSAGGHVLLKPDEESDLARAIKEGIEAKEALGFARERARIMELSKVIASGEAARARFISCNLLLVVAVAKTYRIPGYSLLDIIQDGNMGLIRAVDLFDGELHWRFSTYAIWWIRQSIHKGIVLNARTLRLPAHILDKLRDMQAEDDAMMVARGRAATPEELGELIGRMPEKAAAIRAAGQHSISLSSPIYGDDGEVGDIGDLVKAADDVETEALESAQREDVAKLLASLSDREQDVVRLRMGFDGRPQSLEEVGDRFGLSRERIRQIQVKALTKLRHPCVSTGITNKQGEEI